MSSFAMTGTVEEAFERLERLVATQDKEVWAAQAAYRLLRRVLECWPQQQMVPFFCPRNGDIVIDDDEHCASIRVSPASVALVTLDWTTGDHSEQYTSVGRAALRRILPDWLRIIDESETFDAWHAANSSA